MCIRDRDTGYAKIMTPFFDLETLRRIPGFENARYVDPYAGSKGNSIRYLSVAERKNTMKVCGVENLFCGGEKSGLFVGHTEAISTGSLAGHNAVRYMKGMKLLELPPGIAIGDLISLDVYKRQVVGNVMFYVIALIAGALVGMALLALLKKNISTQESRQSA